MAAVSPSLDVANMLLPTYATFGIFFAGFIRALPAAATGLIHYEPFCLCANIVFSVEFATMPVWWCVKRHHLGANFYCHPPLSP